MALIRFSPRFSPLDALLSLQRELDRTFESPTSGFDLGVSGRGVFPPTNVFSDKDGYIVRMEVPGVTPESLAIEGHGQTLTISGKRETSAPEGASFHRHERNSGEFSRSLQLSNDLDLTKAEATCKHGMLTVRIPKKEEAKPRQIEIKAA
jgi:HSP20 family protein